MKQWLAKLGSERIDEVFDPSLAAQRAIDIYRTKGYDEKWISKRLKEIQDRKELTDIWQENGITDGKEYKQYKGFRKKSLRDNMNNIEIILADLSEKTTKRLAEKHRPQGLEQNKLKFIF